MRALLVLLALVNTIWASEMGADLTSSWVGIIQSR